MQPAELKGLKALDMARGQLDFAALATAAPRVKDVIAHAQTIVPISPVRPWWKPAAALGASALIAAALFVPWLPVTSRLSLVQVSFEQPLSFNQAQSTEAQLMRKLPSDILTSGSFIPLPDEPQAGHLVLQLSALNRQPTAVVNSVSTALMNCPEVTAQPLIKPQDHLTFTEHVSPFNQARAIWQRRHEPKPALVSPSSEISREVELNVELYRKALKRRLGIADYELTAFDFVPKTGAVPVGYDFVIPGWPLDAAVAVREYPVVLDYQQAGIRRVVEELLGQANLLDCSLYSAQDPLYRAPILVQVVDAQNQRDCYLSRRLQSWIDQPDTNQSANRSDTEAALEQALDAYLPQFSYRLSFEYLRPEQSREPAQVVTVELTGARDPEPNQFFRMLPEGEEVDL